MFGANTLKEKRKKHLPNEILRVKNIEKKEKERKEKAFYYIFFFDA